MRLLRFPPTYTPKTAEHGGIEPPLADRQSDVLPLNECSMGHRGLYRLPPVQVCRTPWLRSSAMTWMLLNSKPHVSHIIITPILLWSRAALPRRPNTALDTALYMLDGFAYYRLILVCQTHKHATQRDAVCLLLRQLIPAHTWLGFACSMTPIMHTQALCIWTG